MYTWISFHITPSDWFDYILGVQGFLGRAYQADGGRFCQMKCQYVPTTEKSRIELQNDLLLYIKRNKAEDTA